MRDKDFFDDRKTQDAVIRNCEIIGEAIKHIPDDYRVRHPEWIGEALPGFATCSFTSILALTMWLSGRSQSRNVRFIGQP